MRIYLAGVEQHDSDNGLKDNLFTNVFCSYYYLRDKKWERIEHVFNHTDSIIVDSGAHSFFSEVDEADPTAGMSASVVRKKKKTKVTPDEYFDGYIKWLEAWHEKFDYFVELDIGELVGQEKVLGWRNRLAEKGLMHKCITVYHPKVITYDEYLKELDNSVSRYIALEGDRRSRKRLPYRQLIQPAFERGVKVHGFALVKPKLLTDAPFYSVDSSSWKAGSRFGCLMGNCGGDALKSVKLNELNNNMIKLLGRVTNLKDIHHTTKQLQRDKRYEISIKAYKLLQEYFTELWEVRGIDWEAQIGRK